MNIILKKILNEYFPSLIPSKYLVLVGSILFTGSLQAQDTSFQSRYNVNYLSLIEEIEQDSFPNPKKVFHSSLLIPGWGQVINKQAWKVPLVYGLLGGLTYYSVYLTKQYHDYRAAYYNSFATNTDLRFGPTPDFLMGANASSLQSNRNFLRNRRDFIYVTIALAYLLNAVDAYVFAHLRSFDVSDDLSMNTRIKTDLISSNTIGLIPSVSLTISINKK